VNEDSILTIVFLLFFTEGTKLLVEGANNYYEYNRYLDTFDSDARSQDFLM
jgi:hypothetical protein